MSGRKHKKWEGDALIKVGSRSVVLIETSGKELGRGSGYKIQELADLDDGGRLTVGGKEVEITGSVDVQTWSNALSSAKVKDISVQKERVNPNFKEDQKTIDTNTDTE